MENKENQLFRKELQEKISALKICWVCGRDDYLTMHHVIPQRIHSPFLNLQIPVCENCNHVVHSSDEVLTLLKKIHLK